MSSTARARRLSPAGLADERCSRSSSARSDSANSIGLAWLAMELPPGSVHGHELNMTYVTEH